MSTQINLDTIEKLVILGSGPAGLTAAIYASRAGLNPLVLEGKTPGGQLMGTTYVENWPGQLSILGPDLMSDMRKHAIKFGARLLGGEATLIDLNNRPFSLITHKNVNIRFHALIIATGATPKRLNCPGEDEYWGKGVTTCAICDGAFYKDKAVIIVGGGDSAMENALFMTNFTDNITIVHIFSQLTASKAMQDRVLDNPKIKVIFDSTVTQIEGDGSHVNYAVITNQKTNEFYKKEANAIFIAIGLTPNTKPFKSQLELNKYGYVCLKSQTKTSVEGVFAAGDVADYRYRQAITSAGTGCMAALDAERYIKELRL